MMRRGVPLLVATVLAVTSTSCDDDGSSSETTESPATTTPPTLDRGEPGPVVPIVATETRPLLTMTLVGYEGAPDLLRPADLADLYVYPDGVVVRITRNGRRDALESTTRRVTERRLTSLVTLAASAGLVGGGVQPQLAAPFASKDGGGVRFTLRGGNRTTSRLVDLIDIDSDDDGAARLAFGALYDDLASLAGDGRRTAIQRWIVTAEPVAEFPAERGQWRGIDLDALEWTDLSDGRRCAVVDRPRWKVSADVPMIVRVGREIYSRRPLLRHERNCRDVPSWRDALGLTSAAQTFEALPTADE